MYNSGTRTILIRNVVEITDTNMSTSEPDESSDDDSKNTPPRKLYELQLHNGGDYEIDNCVAASASKREEVFEDTVVDNRNDISNMLELHAIGFGAEKAEMKRYAENLVNIEGCHSIGMIKIHCEDKDVDGWIWMKPMHRKAFKKWLNAARKSV